MCHFIMFICSFRDTFLSRYAHLMQRDFVKQSTGPLLTWPPNPIWGAIGDVDWMWIPDDSNTIQNILDSILLVISCCLTVDWLCYPLYLIPIWFGSLHPWDIIPIFFGSVYPLIGIIIKNLNVAISCLIIFGIWKLF